MHGPHCLMELVWGPDARAVQGAGLQQQVEFSSYVRFRRAAAPGKGTLVHVLLNVLRPCCPTKLIPEALRKPSISLGCGLCSDGE